MAFHYVFDSPKDKIVFDVSHQCYTHKILTGRKDAFYSDEHFSDISGYTNPEVSEHDFFNVGHTSTSVSLACGLAKARDLKGGKENVIAIIGDGSLSGGEALEGLDFAFELGSNFIIIVNDNDMSIAENHGGLYKNLKALRDSNGKCECNLFKAMGLDYMCRAEMIFRCSLKLLKRSRTPTILPLYIFVLSKVRDILLLKLKRKTGTGICRLIRKILTHLLKAAVKTMAA